VAEADLHYQLATYFLEVYGPEMPRYVDLAWHLRQAQDQATLWNVITQPRALRHFLGEEGVGGTDWCVGLLSQFGRCGWNCPAQYLLSLSLCVCLSVCPSVCVPVAKLRGATAGAGSSGAKLEFLKFCRFCRPAADDSYEAVLTQLLTEIEADQEFDLAVVERTARLAQEVGCHQQALLLFKQCNLHLQESEEIRAAATAAVAAAAVDDGEGFGSAAHASSHHPADSDATRVRRAEFLCEIANLHVRHNVPCQPGAPLAATRKEAKDLLLGALDLLRASEQTAPSGGLLDREVREESFPPPGTLISPEVKAMAAVHHVLGLLHYFEGEFAEAAWYGRRAVRGRCEVGELVAAADSLNLCGFVAFNRARHSADGSTSSAAELMQQAETHYMESLTLRQRLLSGNDPAIAQVLNSLGDFHRTQKDFDRASKFYRRSRQVYADSLGSRHYKCSYPTEGLARVSQEQGNGAEACRLLETALEMRSSHRANHHITRSELEQLLDTWRSTLGEAGGAVATLTPRQAAMRSSASLMDSAHVSSPAAQRQQALPQARQSQRFAEAVGGFWDRISTLLSEREGAIDKITRTEREELVYTLLRQIDPSLAAQIHDAGKVDPFKRVSKNIRYDARRVLGLGSMGTKVFRGSYRRAPEEGGGEVAVAVKRVDRALASTITREAQALRAVAAHKHVVQLYGYVNDEAADSEYAYLALELCGTSLEKAVQNDTLQIDPFDLCVQMAQGLQHMHSSTVGAAHGIVHLDLHPGNVLLVEEHGPSSRMIAKISDFGLARTMGQQAGLSTMTHTGAGGWSAPEVRQAGAQGGLAQPKAADIFSLGCILFFSLTRGGHPFGDRHQRELAIARYPSDIDARDLSSASLVVRYAHRHLIEWMTRADPQARPTGDQVCTHPAMWSAAEAGRYLARVARRVTAHPAGVLARELQAAGLQRLQTGGSWQSLLCSAGVEPTPDAQDDCLGLLQQLRQMHDRSQTPGGPSVPWPKVLKAVPWLLITAATLDAHTQSTASAETEEITCDEAADSGLVQNVDPQLPTDVVERTLPIRPSDAAEAVTLVPAEEEDGQPPSLPLPRPLKAGDRVRVRASSVDGSSTEGVVRRRSLQGEAFEVQLLARTTATEEDSSCSGAGQAAPVWLTSNLLQPVGDAAIEQPVHGWRRSASLDSLRTSSLSSTASSPLVSQPDLIPMEEIAFENRIDGGHGANGAVYKARWQSTEVSIKTAKGSGGLNAAQLREILANEIGRVRGLNHPHITAFLGCCFGLPPTSDIMQLMLINELMACSLYDQLHKLRRSESKTIGWLPRVRWAWHICCGMEYIHHRGLLHMDLKSPNILLSAISISATAKIADFGNLRTASSQTLSAVHSQTLTNTTLSDACGSDSPRAADEGIPTRPTMAQASRLVETLDRSFSQQPHVAAEAGQLIGLNPAATDHRKLRAVFERSMSSSSAAAASPESATVASAADVSTADGALGTPEWMAPELLKGSSFASPQCDVYSFSMVMYELLTGARPFEGFPKSREMVRYCGPELVTIWALSGARPTVLANCPKLWAELMASCWSHEPSERPKFSEVASELKRIMDTGQMRKWDADVMQETRRKSRRREQRDSGGHAHRSGGQLSVVVSITKCEAGFGVRVSDAGVVLEYTVPGSAAQVAGLPLQATITAIQGVPVQGKRQILAEVKRVPDGDVVEFRVRPKTPSEGVPPLAAA
jgi:serine/threonine protein kinase/tetratricopeptide (TPR) repeat protein